MGVIFGVALYYVHTHGLSRLPFLCQLSQHATAELQGSEDHDEPAINIEEVEPAPKAGARRTNPRVGFWKWIGPDFWPRLRLIIEHAVEPGFTDCYYLEHNASRRIHLQRNCQNLQNTVAQPVHRVICQHCLMRLERHLEEVIRAALHGEEQNDARQHAD